MRVLGVDACKTGWVAVLLEGGKVAAVQVDESFEALARNHSDVEVIAVDMPVGLPADCERRACDQPARDFVGARRSSVFPAPSQRVLDAASHADASDLSRRLTGKGVSQQAYALRSKIREVAHAAYSDARVIEVHPEISFCALAGSTPLKFAKKSWNGQMRRLHLLQGAGIDLPEALDAAGGVPADDVLDAAVAAWSAHRYATSVAEAFPESAEPGDRPVIWY